MIRNLLGPGQPEGYFEASAASRSVSYQESPPTIDSVELCRSVGDRPAAWSQLDCGTESEDGGNCSMRARTALETCGWERMNEQKGGREVVVKAIVEVDVVVVVVVIAVVVVVVKKLLR